MKIKPLILLLASFLLVACSNGNQETAEKSFGEKAKTTKVSKESSSKSENSSESTSETEKTNEELYDDIIASYPTEYNSNSHAFYDLNNDGVDEMIIGKSDFAEALYYIVSGKPVKMAYAYDASAGGHRRAFDIYDNGQVMYYSWNSLSPWMNVTVYKIVSKDKPAEITNKMEEYNFQTNKPSDVGISTTRKLDLTKLSWIQIDSKINTESEQDPYLVDLHPSASDGKTYYRDGFYISIISPVDGKTAVISEYVHSTNSVPDHFTVPIDDAYDFLHWIRETAPNGTTKNGLKSNYVYWVENVK